MPSARSTRARPTDDQLLDAALAVFATRGFRGTTMAALATAANSTKPTLYAHFGDKESLFARLLEREAAACRTILFESYADNAELDLAEQVEADTQALFTYADKHPQGFALLFGRDITTSAARIRENLLDEVQAQLATRVHDYLVRHHPAGTTAAVTEDEGQVAAMLAAVALGAAQHALTTGGDPGRAARLAAAFSTSALLGLLGRAP